MQLRKFFFVITLLFFSASVFASQTWIFVQSDTKLPLKRPGQTTAYFTYADGFDPNAGSPFAPEYTFVPVVDVPQPEYSTCSQVNDVNPVLQKVTPVFTNGVDNTYRGEYVAATGQYPYGSWETSWDVTTQDLSASKEAKLTCLQEDFDAAIAGGYAVGQFVFPFSNDFLNLLIARRDGLSAAIDNALLTNTDKVTFSDVNGKEVSVTLTQIGNNLASYFVAFRAINETEVAARNDISDATTISAVNSVTWTF